MVFIVSTYLKVRHLFEGCIYYFETPSNAFVCPDYHLKLQFLIKPERVMSGILKVIIMGTASLLPAILGGDKSV